MFFFEEKKGRSVGVNIIFFTILVRAKPQPLFFGSVTNGSEIHLIKIRKFSAYSAPVKNEKKE